MRKALNQVNVKCHLNTAVDINHFIAWFIINVPVNQNTSHHMMARSEIQNSKKFFLINIIQGNLLKISCLPRQRGGSRGVDAWKQLKVEETHFHLTPTGSSNLSNASKELWTVLRGATEKRSFYWGNIWEVLSLSNQNPNHSVIRQRNRLIYRYIWLMSL